MTAGQIDWSLPPQHLTLAPGQLHVWRFTLETVSATELATLSPEESERSHRYRFRRDRERFVAGRVILRQILARYVSQEPGQVRFVYSERGRPSLDLAGPCGETFAGFDFNLSHSEDRAVLAVGAGVRVGIDLERIDADKVGDGLLGFVCTPSELQHLNSLPRREQVDRFYQCWTRKEAYLKAHGDGLILPMNQILVLGVNGHEVTPSESVSGGDPTRTWSLLDLSAWPGFAAALAWSTLAASAGGSGRPLLSLWDWRPS